MASTKRIGVPEALIIIGSSVFVTVLLISAIFEADIRWLHFFQAWMYIACCLLAIRQNRWGYFIGLSAAAFWNYASLFVNTFAVNGAVELLQWIRTGHLHRADQFIAAPAWLGNLLVIAGCAWAYARHIRPERRDILRLAVAFVGTSAFFAMAMAFFQPRYLPLFQQSLHPHWPSTKGR